MEDTMNKVTSKSKTQQEFLNTIRQEVEEIKEKQYTFGRDDTNDKYFQMQDEFDTEDLDKDKNADYNIYAKSDEISHKAYMVSPTCFKNSINYLIY